ncbi:26686_t:CDS:1, partial [Racocetra persica]
MGIEKPVDKLLPKLEEIKRFIAEQLSGAYLYSNSDSIYSKKAHGKDNYS